MYGFALTVPKSQPEIQAREFGWVCASKSPNLALILAQIYNGFQYARAWNMAVGTMLLSTRSI